MHKNVGIMVPCQYLCFVIQKVEVNELKGMLIYITKRRNANNYANQRKSEGMNVGNEVRNPTTISKGCANLI